MLAKSSADKFHRSTSNLLKAKLREQIDERKTVIISLDLSADEKERERVAEKTGN